MHAMQRGKPVAFVFNKQGRYPSAPSKGLEEGIADMHRGGIRQLDLPASQGLGIAIAAMPVVPPGTALRVLITLEEVSPAYFAN